MVDQLRPARPAFRTGDDALDARIADLIESSPFPEDADLLREMLAACFRLARDHSDRGEMKLVNAALKEFAYAFRVFKQYRGIRKVSIFGSSRATPDDPDFEYARRFGYAMAQRGWMVITGAGPGIMEAGHLGAGAERSFGVNIRLPLEQDPNEVIEGDPKLINFRYFFTRKVTFLKESHAFVMFPGGFGTLDEAFELLTLMQTGKAELHPVILLEAPGGSYWKAWLRFVHGCLVDGGFISTEDTDFFLMTDSIEEAVAEIDRFYRNYQSQRYVNGTLVLRVLRVPSDEDLARAGEQFADILTSPGLKVVDPSPAEVAEGDALEYRRIALHFNRHHHGRLRKLIDVLNEY